MLRKYKSLFISKDEAQRRSKETDRELKRAGKDIIARILYRCDAHLEKLEGGRLDGASQRELERLWDGIVEEVFNEYFNLPEAEGGPASLRAFIQEFCDQRKPYLIENHVHRLQRDNREGIIALPTPLNPERKRGQPRTYKRQDLLDIWPELCCHYPTLPPLKPR